MSKSGESVYKQLRDAFTTCISENGKSSKCDGIEGKYKAYLESTFDQRVVMEGSLFKAHATMDATFRKTVNHALDYRAN